MLKCTTTEKFRNAVAWTLKFKPKFRLKLGLNLGLNKALKYAEVYDHRGGQECRGLDP
jgi:hypothetical protein